jgi:hypothetical protein
MELFLRAWSFSRTIIPHFLNTKTINNGITSLNSRSNPLLIREFKKTNPSLLDYSRGFASAAEYRSRFSLGARLLCDFDFCDFSRGLR